MLAGCLSRIGHLCIEISADPQTSPLELFCIDFVYILVGIFETEGWILTSWGNCSIVHSVFDSSAGVPWILSCLGYGWF